MRSLSKNQVIEWFNELKFLTATQIDQDIIILRRLESKEQTLTFAQKNALIEYLKKQR